MKWLLTLLVLGRVVHADPAPAKAPRDLSIETKPQPVTLGSRLVARIAWTGPDANVMAPACSGCELAPTVGFKFGSTHTAEDKLVAVATGAAFAIAIGEALAGWASDHGSHHR